MAEGAMEEGVSVLQGAPRTLDVQRFSKTRASEIQALFSALKTVQNSQRKAHLPNSAALQRHLRRRTTSYSKRRFLPFLYKKRRAPSRISGVSDAAGKYKRRKADVEQGTRGEGDENEHKTTSSESKERSRKRLPRALRRRLEFKEKTGGCSGDGTRRLATHVWHAKRFSMTKRWGYWLPLGRSGRGHGSRAVLRWAKHAALLHDASFYSAIQLSGPQKWLLKVLQLVLQPPPTESSEKVRLQLSGTCYGVGVLHQMGQVPHGMIAPVLFLWQPVVPEHGCASSSHKVLGEGGNEESVWRRLWIWVHAAAFHEAFQSLQGACNKLNEESGGAILQCSKRGDLGRLDLLGSKSLEVLKKVLHPVHRGHPCSSNLLEKSDRNPLDFKVIQLDQLSSEAAIATQLYDPRFNWNRFGWNSQSYLEADVEAMRMAIFNDAGTESKDQELGSKVEMKNIGEASLELEASIGQDLKDSKSDEISLKWDSGNSNMDQNLWANSCGAGSDIFLSPLDEKILTKKWHKWRLGSYHLDEVATKNARRSYKNHENFPFSENSHCPVVILKHGSQKPSTCGWSIILPLNWVRVFWIPLVFAGGHVIGLRERHWLSTNAGLPSFPHDFPDSPAYARYVLAKSRVGAEPMFKQMHSERQYKGIISQEKHASQQGEFIKGVSEFRSSGSGSDTLACTQANKSANSSQSQNACVESFFPHFVARTGIVLTEFLIKANHRHALLFPEKSFIMGRVRYLHRVLNEGALAWRVKTSSSNCDKFEKKRCFLRLLIRPSGKGSLQEGTLLYAPSQDDLKTCLRRKGTLNFPSKEAVQQEATFGSSSQAGSKKGQKSTREPIGFVTSAAPRGSASSSSIAFCDAITLGNVRERQWVEARWCNNQQIFLLVRNPRSNMYRPAIASVALEESPDIS